MNIPFHLKIGEWLYKHAYMMYQPVYFYYKKQQEKIEIECIQKILHKNDSVVDIGANVGFYTLLFSKIVGDNGKVFAFEPDVDNFEKLKRNTLHLNNVKIENKAISNHSGKITLYHSPLNVDHRTYPSDDVQQAYQIDCITLDDYFQMINSNIRLCLIKMDIQGFEPIAIQGMLQTIQKNPQVSMITEFWPYGIQKAGSSATSYLQQLKQLFSYIYLIEKNGVQLIDDKFEENLEYKPFVYYNLLASNNAIF
ncbi:MAG: FkbM family methyltransferase [Bacteroidia bacterium]|nr:FkbM family methyltransferase [Bacteroidia bacterium]